MRRRFSQIKPSTGARGFTLLEVIIAVAIIGIMAAAIGPLAIRQINRVRVDATYTELERIRESLIAYYEDIGSFPSQNAGLASLISDASSGWRGPYIEFSHDNPIEAVTTDAFGETYLYDLSPSIASGSSTDLIIASMGVNRRQDLGAIDGEWPLEEIALHDDLILTVSHAGLDRDKRNNASVEIDSLAMATRRYYYSNGEFPTDLLDLSGAFIDAGVDQDAFYDGWNQDYLSDVTLGSDPVFSIWSSGPDQIDDAGGEDDILIEINSAMLSQGGGSEDDWDWTEEGNYSLYLVTTAQAALDADTDLNLTSSDLKRYLDDLGLSSIFGYDEWGKKMKINKDTREVYSSGPDGKGDKTDDNIPAGVGS